MEGEQEEVAVTLVSSVAGVEDGEDMAVEATEDAVDDVRLGAVRVDGHASHEPGKVTEQNQHDGESPCGRAKRGRDAHERRPG